MNRLRLPGLSGRTFCIALLLLLQACSSSSTGSGSACNNLVDDAATVTTMEVAQARPTPGGGTISDGTYALTALTAYTGAGGAAGSLAESGSLVMTISGSTMQQAGHLNGQAKSYTSNVATSGTTLTTMDTCPSPDSATHAYTATPAALRIYDTVNGVELVQTYTKR